MSATQSGRTFLAVSTDFDRCDGVPIVRRRTPHPRGERWAGATRRETGPAHGQEDWGLRWPSRSGRSFTF